MSEEIVFILIVSGLLAAWAFGMWWVDRPKKTKNLTPPEDRADTLASVIEFREIANKMEANNAKLRALGQDVDDANVRDARHSADVLERMVEQCDRGELGGESLGWALGKIASRR